MENITGLRKVFFLFLVLIIFFLTIYLVKSDSNKNILGDTNINTGNGWKNYQSYYSGSEISFSFKNSNEISFTVETDSNSDQGIEIFIDNEKYILSSPNLNNQKLSITVDKNKPHTVAIRHFCSFFNNPCQIKLSGIFLESSAVITPYQKHSKVLSVLGDSISTIYGRYNYSQILADNLGYELHNASIMGSTLSNTERADDGIDRYKKDLMQSNSDAIIIFMGSNDIKGGISLSDFSKDYSKIVTDVKTFNSKSKIFLVGILHRKDLNDAIIYKYNEIIKDIAKINKAYYIDTNSWLEENDYADEIHPSIEGQKKILDNFGNFLYPILK